MKQAVIAIFVPHLGCPLRCSFCNQNEISGEVRQVNEEDVINACNEALKYLPEDKYGTTEIAYFGGSFTAIERETMISLLDVGKKLCDKYGFMGLRCSTRPDCVDDNTLDVLKKYGMTTIEIGCQSLDEEVLLKNHRGHTANDCLLACKRIKEHGFKLGVQMMTGLPFSSDEKDLMTAKLLASEHPDYVRIYPALVLENTLMAKWYRDESYTPQTIDEAAEVCASIMEIFESVGTEIIKVGLNSERSLEEALVAGPYHEAFRELCEGRIMFKKLVESFREKPKGDYIVYVNPRFISRTAGHKKENILLLKDLGYNILVKADTDISEKNSKIERL